MIVTVTYNRMKASFFKPGEHEKFLAKSSSIWRIVLRRPAFIGFRDLFSTTEPILQSLLRRGRPVWGLTGMLLVILVRYNILIATLH